MKFNFSRSLFKLFYEKLVNVFSILNPREITNLKTIKGSTRDYL